MKNTFKLKKSPEYVPKKEYTTKKLHHLQQNDIIQHDNIKNKGGRSYHSMPKFLLSFPTGNRFFLIHHNNLYFYLF
jgi:hypothetical protein